MENVKIMQIDDDTLSISIPIKIIKRKGYVTAILPENAKEYQGIENPQNYNEKLVNAFANAYKWQEMINSGEVSSLNEIAEVENLEKSYVGKIFRLNHVAPDIIKLILDGKQPENLKLRDFTRKAVPDLWEEQREVFGFGIKKVTS